jgi:hypothetical protein
LFRKACADKGQTLSFCGVNAHFQNGMAEKRIRDLQDAARTMIIHAQKRWPDAISVPLWPYALRTANDIHAETPRLKDGHSPLEIFSGVRVKPNMRHFHPFGCPTYVLHNSLQAGHKIPKWQDRARVGIYLGRSPQHARTVALVLNLQTGLTSPQFHVVHDDMFETTRSQPTRLLPQSLWQEKTGFVKSRVRFQAGNAVEQPSTEPIVAPPAQAAPVVQPHEGAADQDQGEQLDFPPDDADHPDVELPLQPLQDQVPLAANPPLRRSQRTPKPSRRVLESLETSHVAFEALAAGDDQGVELDLHPLAYKATSDPDTMYLDQALRQPDRDKFIQAMVKEVADQTKRGHWRIIKRSEVPQGIKVLPAVWSMKRKRRIDTREVYKWKARLNIHGGRQEWGVNYWETYSPVVNWSSIRLFLTLSLLAGWHTRQLDFVLAYPQAPVECDLYMEIPRGFHFQGSRKSHVLQILQNIYGQKQAGRVWNQHLTKGLLARGFKQSWFDECVFYKDGCVVLIYVDDTIICGPTKALVDAVVEALATGFDVSDEGDISDYLGVKVERHPQGKIKLSQPHLIQQIIDDLWLQSNSKEFLTPASISAPLSADTDGEPFDEHWHYRSVIGKLNFLEKSSRPDIAYAVHQCARFSESPRKSHADAVKRIGRYLKATKDKGLILDPKRHSFDCWVDASFAGDWNRDTAMDDVHTAKSRSGFVLMYANCPVIWASKLQTEIALSTTEAEYVSLSQALREVIPVLNMLIEANAHGITVTKDQPKIHCKLFEDNSGALELAKVPKMRPRTKHINIKYHHFRDYVRQGLVTVHAVASTSQVADMFTKPLPRNLFSTFRKFIMGW